MRWTAQKREILLLKILEVHGIKLNYEKISAAWPDEPGEERPTPIAVMRQLQTIRDNAKSAGKTGGFCIGTSGTARSVGALRGGSGPAQRAPASASRRGRKPGTMASQAGGRRRAVKDESEEDIMSNTDPDPDPDPDTQASENVARAPKSITTPRKARNPSQPPTGLLTPVTIPRNFQDSKRTPRKRSFQEIDEDCYLDGDDSRYDGDDNQQNGREGTPTKGRSRNRTVRRNVTVPVMQDEVEELNVCPIKECPRHDKDLAFEDRSALHRHMGQYHN